MEMCHNGEINRYLKKTGRPVGQNEGKVQYVLHVLLINTVLQLKIYLKKSKLPIYAELKD